MRDRNSKWGRRLGGLREALVVALAMLAFAASAPAAQAPVGGESPLIEQPASAAAQKKRKEHLPAQKQGPQPSVTIPLAPLGFATPTTFYFGERFAMVSLNFLDEDTLLFTFRVPGLIAREPAVPGQKTVAERHIRALTLELPSGRIEAESLWVEHDYSRYLWTMQGGKFLLRDRNLLQMGDKTLRLQPLLRFPGQVNSVQFDPGQHLLITDTTEPPAPEAGRNAPGTAAAGPASQQSVSDPATAAARISVRSSANPASDPGAKPDAKPGANSGANSGAGADSPESQRIVRILRMGTWQPMLFSHTNGSVHLAVDGDGYYDTLRSGEERWLVAFEFFNGASKPIGLVESDCDPNLDAMASGIVLVSACLPNGARHLTAFSRDRASIPAGTGDKDHARLWDVTLPPTKVWPQWATSEDGMRFARSTLEVTHPIGIFSPLDDADVRGQSVQVYDLATGATVLSGPLAPVLDGGGNFALSPSGRRLAVLYDGSIQVYDLPPVAPLPPVGPGAPKTASKP